MSFLNFCSYSFKVTAMTAMAALIFDDGKVVGQVVSDDTTGTQIQSEDGIFQITGGTKSGSNLFHSFDRFSLGTEDVASFSNAPAISNIFSRVTGGTVSELDGLIQTQGDASLFLLNPAGIVFGANAQLDIGGSFVVSTGDRLIFADGVEFSADNPEESPLLTISSPVGLQYGADPGAIEVLPQSDLEVAEIGLSLFPGNTLAFLGGDVSLTSNRLDAVGSNVELGSVKSGTVALQPDEYGWQFDYANTSDLGQISLRDGALISTSGRTNFYGATIEIATGSGITDFNRIGDRQSRINLEASESINIDGGLLITQVGQQRNNIDRAIANTGGDMLIKAPEIFFDRGAIVSAGTLSEGASGNITIEGSRLVKLSTEAGNNPSIISTSTIGSGDGGQIAIKTRDLVIEDGSQVQALAGEGAGGTISVDASRAIDISGTGILTSADSDGNLVETELSSGLFASSGIEGLPLAQQPKGESGSLIVNSSNLRISDRGQISVSNFGTANAGDIEITTDNLNLDTSGQIIANTASGEGGSIGITANRSVILDGESSITTTAKQNGNGGNIAIAAENLVLRDLNRIAADARQGNGGNITIDTTGLFISPNSSITASSEVEQNDGNVEIFTLDLNSRLAIDYREQSSLKADRQIAKRCGTETNLADNQFRDLGRGGIPSNPLKENPSRETVADLGRDPHEVSTNRKQVKRAKNAMDKSDYVTRSSKQPQSLLEANDWLVNSRGRLELVAKHGSNYQAQDCTMGRG